MKCPQLGSKSREYKGKNKCRLGGYCVGEICNWLAKFRDKEIEKIKRDWRE